MPRRLATEAVLTAIVTTLKNSTGVTALLSSTGAIYNHVPQNAAYPYVEVSAPTDFRQDTCGRFGAETLVDVKAISQAPGDQEATRIADQCLRALDFATPAMTGHQALGIRYDGGTRFREVVNGIVTRHQVVSLRVWSEQSSS